ncbi:MAG: hypothetical protein ACO3FE_03040 [Planctomycetaceae bacterium]
MTSEHPQTDATSLVESWRSRAVKAIAVVALLCGVAVYSTSAAWRNPTTSVALPPQGSRTVALFNIWSMLWNSKQILTPQLEWWNAPVFFPEQGSFAWSEPQPITMLLTPLLQNGQGALAYNLLLLFSLVMNGLLTLRLLRFWQICLPARLAAAIAVLLLPMVHEQLDVLQLTALWPFLWLLTAASALNRAAVDATGRLRITLHGAETGLAFVIIAAGSVHHALFVALLMGTTGWILVPWTRLSAWWPGLLASAVVSLSLLLPLLLSMKESLERHKFERSESLVEKLSVDLVDFSIQPKGYWLFQNATPHKTWSPMCPGYVRCGLAGLAAVLLLARVLTGRPASGPRSRELLFLIAFACASFNFSLGMHLGTESVKVWPVLTSAIPGFGHVRSPFRFGYFFQLSIVLLAAAGLHTILRRPVPDSRFARRLQLTIACGVAAVLAFEILPQPLATIGVPRISEKPDWADVIADRQQHGEGTLLLPYAVTSRAVDFEQTVRWMIQATAADLPLANGYSGFFPKSHFQLQRTLNEPTCTAAAIRLIRNRRIRFVIAVDADSSNWLQSAPPGTFQILQQLDSGITVYQFVPAG